MKKILMWVLAATLTCGTTTVLTSCDDDDVEDVMENLNIVGKWTGTATVSPEMPEDMEFEFDGTVEFKADGTYVSIDPDGDSNSGTWALRDKTLTLTQTEEGISFSDVYKIQDGWTRDKMTLVGTFTDEDDNGKTVTYTVTITMNRVK